MATRKCKPFYLIHRFRLQIWYSHPKKMITCKVQHVAIQDRPIGVETSRIGYAEIWLHLLWWYCCPMRAKTWRGHICCTTTTVSRWTQMVSIATSYVLPAGYHVGISGILCPCHIVTFDSNAKCLWINMASTNHTHYTISLPGKLSDLPHLESPDWPVLILINLKFIAIVIYHRGSRQA